MSKSEISPTQKILNIWAVVLFFWSLYRATFKIGFPIWFDEFIAKPLIFLLPIFLFISKFEKKHFLKGIGFSKKNIGKDILFGFVIGSFFVCIALLIRATKGLPLSSLQISPTAIIWIVSTIMAAAMEQILSTGFVFNRLYKESKNILRPLLISAFLFFFIHIPVLFGADKISGSTLIQVLLLNTVLSFTTSIVFALRKNTISPIIVHALYLLSLPILL